MSPPAKKTPMTVNEFKRAFTAVSNAGRYKRYKNNREAFEMSFRARGLQPPPMTANEFRVMFQLLSNHIRQNRIAKRKKKVA